jgi:CubicO group peptidase (beta-lactamase class C family)
VRPAGELSTYSNYGAALAGTIVEQVSGQPFEQYVEEHILKPLDMQHTTLRQPIPANLIDDLAMGYTYSDGAFHIEPFVYIQTPPAGSMFTTATDMAHFMIAQLEGGQLGDAHILLASTAQQMQQPLFTNDTHAGGWAYGFMEMNLNDQLTRRSAGMKQRLSTLSCWVLASHSSHQCC